jgi:phage terminase small subunit
LKQIGHKTRKLTQKERAFVIEYQKDFSGTDAVLRAKYHPKDRQIASQIAWTLLHRPLVAEALERDVSERLKRLGDRADATIEELLKIGHFDIRKLFNTDGSLKPPVEWDDATAAAVAGLQVVELEGRGEGQAKIGQVKKLKMLDKTKALELLGRHQKLFGTEGEGTKIAVIILQPGDVHKPANSGMSEEEDYVDISKE